MQLSDIDTERHKHHRSHCRRRWQTTAPVQLTSSPISTQKDTDTATTTDAAAAAAVSSLSLSLSLSLSTLLQPLSPSVPDNCSRAQRSCSPTPTTHAHTDTPAPLLLPPLRQSLVCLSLDSPAATVAVGGRRRLECTRKLLTDTDTHAHTHHRCRRCRRSLLTLSLLTLLQPLCRHRWQTTARVQLSSSPTPTQKHTASATATAAAATVSSLCVSTLLQPLSPVVANDSSSAQ